MSIVHLYDPPAPPKQEHTCVGGKISTLSTYWIKDGYGIPLCRACPDCEDEKLAQFRPDIKSRYDADEPIDDEDGGYGGCYDDGPDDGGPDGW